METFETFLVSTISLLIVINPTAVASVYIGLTASASRAERRAIAIRATVTGATILTVFALAGTFVLGKLRISGAALQIAGGILIFGFAFALARGKERTFFEPIEEERSGSPRGVAYSPLAVPLIAGPAGITVVMTAATKAEVDPYAWAALLSAILATCAWTAFTMLNWSRLAEAHGATVRSVLPRIMGLVLAVIAVQFVIDGASDVVARIARELDAAAIGGG